MTSIANWTSIPRREPHVLEWSLPVVHDCLKEFYRDALPAANGARTLMTERHFALWTTLIDEDFEHLQADRHLLDLQAGTLRVDEDVWGAADRYVAAEILDICLRRFRRMPSQAQANSAALLNILKHLRGDADKAVFAQAA
jgi:hypothetical protein